MNKKKANNKDGIVFSTDPGFSMEEDQVDITTLAPDKQMLKISLDKKQRAGKAVTLVDGFVGKEEDMDTLGKQLKNFCGTGGSVKDGYIIIQGDQRDKVLQWLQKNDYKKSKKI